jgi:hypothetical protein
MLAPALSIVFPSVRTDNLSGSTSERASEMKKLKENKKFALLVFVANFYFEKFFGCENTCEFN